MTGRRFHAARSDEEDEGDEGDEGEPLFDAETTRFPPPTSRNVPPSLPPSLP